MQSTKEAAANVAASAKAGMEKTKATMQEKGEKLTTHDPMKKDIAQEKKEERIHQAELQKQEARGQNVATRQAAAAGMGQQGYTTGTTATAEGEIPQDPNIAGGAGTGHGTGSTY